MLFYLIQKSKQYLELGYLLYRNRDFFYQPPLDISTEEHEKLAQICQQIVGYGGTEGFEPIAGVSLSHIQIFAQMMHCHVVSSSAEEVFLQHSIQKELSIRLYCEFTNLVPMSRKPFVFTDTKSVNMSPTFPEVRYQPILKSSRLIKSGAIGECWYQLHTDCQTSGSISYQSLLLCIDLHKQLPCFIVSEEIGLECIFLCTFDSNGHHNLGAYEFASVDAFFATAFPLVEEFLEKTTPEYPFLGQEG